MIELMMEFLASPVGSLVRLVVGLLAVAVFMAGVAGPTSGRKTRIALITAGIVGIALYVANSASMRALPSSQELASLSDCEKKDVQRYTEPAEVIDRGDVRSARWSCRSAGQSANVRRAQNAAMGLDPESEKEGEAP